VFLYEQAHIIHRVIKKHTYDRKVSRINDFSSKN